MHQLEYIYQNEMILISLVLPEREDNYMLKYSLRNHTNNSEFSLYQGDTNIPSSHLRGNITLVKSRGVGRIFRWGAKPSSEPTGEQVGGLSPEDLYNF